MIAAKPSANRPLPSAARAIAGPGKAELVWENELGGLTYELPGQNGRRFLKWTSADYAPKLRAEADRLEWAVAFTSVPHVLDVGDDGTNAWLLTVGLPGTNAVTDRWRAEPATAVRALGAGLRALHARLPVEECPFSWSVDDRLAEARECTKIGDDELRRAAAPPPVDRLVVCHGDACAPNTLLDDDGSWSGHVDLGALGVADRWADLAVATWSTTWNYGPGWEEELLAAYGVDPDPERTAYYRMLWDLGP